MFRVANMSVEHKEYIVRVAHIGEVFLSHALGCRQVLNLSYKFDTKKAMVGSAHSTKICFRDLIKRSHIQCCAHLYKILLLVKPCSGLHTVILISICQLIQYKLALLVAPWVPYICDHNQSAIHDTLHNTIQLCIKGMFSEIQVGSKILPIDVFYLTGDAWMSHKVFFPKL